MAPATGTTEAAEPTGAAEPTLLVDATPPIARLTLNRPDKRNALDAETVVRLADAWATIVADPAIRVVLLTGAGDQAFCAGADLTSLIPLLTRARPAADAWDERLLAEPQLMNAALLRRTDMAVPVIAAVRGFALAGGTELVLASDLRVVSDDARLGLTEVRRGLLPAAGGTVRLPRQIPRARAAELLLLGDHLTAADALALGLVNRVVPGDEVLACATELAERMAANGPLALRTIKQTMLQADGLPLLDAFGVEDDGARIVMRSNDAKEGARAFAEKRPPQFTGT